MKAIFPEGKDVMQKCDSNKLTEGNKLLKCIPFSALLNFEMIKKIKRMN